MQKFVLWLSLSSCATAMAGPQNDFTCKFNDRAEEELVEFKLAGDYQVRGATEAVLQFDAQLRFKAHPSDPQGDAFVFARSAGLAGTHHQGRKYRDHFRFDLQWSGVEHGIERGILYIARLPSRTDYPSDRLTVETFTGVMDVSWNDHHGDYVWVKCVRRSWN